MMIQVEQEYENCEFWEAVRAGPPVEFSDMARFAVEELAGSRGVQVFLPDEAGREIEKWFSTLPGWDANPRPAVFRTFSRRP